MNSTNDWEEEFDKRFPDWQWGMGKKDVSDFIRTLLASQKSALLDGLVMKKKDDPWAYGFNLDMTTGYNQAVREQNERIKEARIKR